MSARITHIDGLRAVAVVAVVLYHSAIVHPHLNRSGFTNFVLGQGCHGVELFFVLSGFCLAYPSLSKISNGSRTFDIPRYATHRIVRILPPYYIALLAFALLFAATQSHLERLGPSNLVRQIAFMDRGTDFVNPSFWTLPIELRWYLLMPGALLLWVRAPRAFLVALVLLIIAAGQTRAGSLDLVSLPGFLLGIVAAHLFIRRTPFDRFALPLCIVSIVFAMIVSPTRQLYGAIEIPWEIAAALLVIAVGANSFLQRALSLRVFTFVGAASYSIYLVHEPLMELVEAHGVLPTFAVLAGIGAGILFWAIAERPFVSSRLREALLKRIEPLVREVFSALGPTARTLPAACAASEPREPFQSVPAPSPSSRSEHAWPGASVKRYPDRVL